MTDFNQPLNQLFCIEVFAGSGRLTASLKSLGLVDSIGVDCTAPPRLACPILQLDLLKPSHLDLLKDLISSPNCVYVRMAPPCGTASRARLIQRRGRNNPPIVRTDSHPDGIPGLSGTLLARVESANKLCEITCDLIRLCERWGKLWSVENPGRSFMWQTTPFARLLQEIKPESMQFHHCMYGSGRRKLTKLLHNLKRFADLGLCYTNDHEHEPWGQTSNGRWVTALEVVYPWDLCRAMAGKVALEFQDRGTTCSPPCFDVEGDNRDPATQRPSTNGFRIPRNQATPCCRTHATTKPPFEHSQAGGTDRECRTRHLWWTGDRRHSQNTGTVHRSSAASWTSDLSAFAFPRDDA